MPARLGADQPRAAQQAQVARDRGAADRQRVGQRLDRALAVAQPLEDRAAVRVGQGLEDAVLHAHRW